MPTADADFIHSDTDRDAVVELMEGALRPGSSAWLRDEQPAIFSIAASGEICIIRDGGEIVAGAACVPRVAVTPAGKLKIGLIGAVATKLAFRGRGFAGSALDYCENWLRAEGCAAALLWADTPDYYKKRNYIEAGTEYIIDCPPLRGLDFDGTCELYRPEYLHDVERIRGRESAHTDRPRAESAQHYQFSGTRVYVYKEKNGRITAYAALGRGGDLKDVVHECGGSAQGILSLVSYAIDERGLDSVLWILSPHRRDILEIVTSVGIVANAGHLGMVKCLDRDALADSLRRQFPAEAHFTFENSHLDISLAGQTARLSEHELVRAAFGYKSTRDPLDRLELTLQLPDRFLQSVEPGFGGFDSV